MSSSAFNDPNHATLLKIWHEMDVPGFVKEAEATTEQDYKLVDVKHFGSPTDRTYPVNTKSNTWLSREHFRRDMDAGKIEKTAAEIIEARISKAASFWNLDEPMRIRDAEPQHTIFHVTIDGDHNVEKTTIDLTGHFKQACDKFYAERATYPYAVRRSFARQVLEAPEDVKEPLDTEVEQGLCKMANYGACTGPTAQKAVFRRMCYVRKQDPETFGQLVKVAKHLGDTDGLVDIDLLHKTALILDTVDRANGLHVQYGRDLESPEDELFSFTEKRASHLQDDAVIMPDGSITRRHELVESREHIDEYFTKIAGAVPYTTDDEMIDALTKLHASDVEHLYNFLGVEEAC